jgi:hypothetical protein
MAKRNNRRTHGKSKKSSRVSAGARRLTVGRDVFAKISAVEGLFLSSEMKGDFTDFDRKKLSPEERRRAIVAKYARTSS